MKKILTFPFLILIVFSCGKGQNESNSKSEVVEIDSTSSSQKGFTETNTVERFFPEELMSSQFDTLLTENNLSISIKSSFINTYVTNEYESDKTKYIDKYRDSEHHLIISKSNSVLIDTVLKKENTIEFNEQEFLDVATFHRIWFNEVDGSKLVFFATITKPETDWTFPFYYTYDFKKNELTLEPYVEEEI